MTRMRAAVPVLTLASVVFAQHALETQEQKGAKLFAVTCAACHGRNGEGAQSQAQGVKPPDLSRGEFKSGNSPEALSRVIAKGLPSSGMPGFEHLGGELVQQLVAFVGSLSRVQSSKIGDVSGGEALFWGKADCGRCHAVGSKGVNLGPDLTRGGRRVTAEHLRRAIIAPDDEIADGFELVSVETRDKQTITGLQRYFDNFSARLIDSSGAERTFLRNEVLSMRREMKSAMPGNYSTLLTRAELDDVVAYLLKVQSERSSQR
jgi:putative heme-binding domain-containing protein